MLQLFRHSFPRLYVYLPVIGAAVALLTIFQMLYGEDDDSRSVVASVIPIEASAKQRVEPVWPSLDNPSEREQSPVQPNVVEVKATDLEVQEVDLLGVSIQLRELRTYGENSRDGELRNLEFFIREGILPRRLFDDVSQLITGYWPLFHNNVGYGASTVRLLYQVVERDSNGDGRLTVDDLSTLAVSLPDGSDYRVIDSEVGHVLDVTYLSDRRELVLELMTDSQAQQRVYFLGEAGSRPRN